MHGTVSYFINETHFYYICTIIKFIIQKLVMSIKYVMEPVEIMGLKISKKGGLVKVHMVFRRSTWFKDAPEVVYM